MSNIEQGISNLDCPPRLDSGETGRQTSFVAQPSPQGAQGAWPCFHGLSAVPQGTLRGHLTVEARATFICSYYTPNRNQIVAKFRLRYRASFWPGFAWNRRIRDCEAARVLCKGLIQLRLNGLANLPL